jgi:hypothetical protein
LSSGKDILDNLTRGIACSLEKSHSKKDNNLFLMTLSLFLILMFFAKYWSSLVSDFLAGFCPQLYTAIASA